MRVLVNGVRLFFDVEGAKLVPSEYSFQVTYWTHWAFESIAACQVWRRFSVLPASSKMPWFGRSSCTASATR